MTHADPSTMSVRQLRSAPDHLAALLSVLLGASAGTAFLIVFGLQEFAFTDYETEALPAVHSLVAGDLAGFARKLPGYGGALILQAPFAVLGNSFGGDADLWAWRMQAVPGLLLLFGLAVVLGTFVSERNSGLKGAVWGGVTALLVAGTPFATTAEEYGHVEEALVAGLAVLGVLVAGRGNLATSGVVIGAAAAAKPWAVIAVPVVLLAAENRREFLRIGLCCVAAGLLVSAPAFAAGGTAKVVASAHTATTGTFRPDNVFWFAGKENPDWTPPRRAASTPVAGVGAVRTPGWAQRLEPAWAARVSHPAVVAFAILLCVGAWRLRSTLDRRGDLLLLLATACWWRCLLDTWNVHYYALAASLALAAWEAHRGRPPVVAIAVTAAAWLTLQIIPASALTPDVHTAMYLGWGVPLGIALVVRALAPKFFARRCGGLLSVLSSRLPSLARAVSPGT